MIHHLRFTITILLSFCSHLVAQGLDLIPITAYASVSTPLLTVAIEDAVYTMEVDIGYCGQAALLGKFFPEIQNKTFTRTEAIYGIKGKAYASEVYRVPLIHTCGFNFYDCELQVEDDNLLKDAILKLRAIPFMPKRRSHGRVGLKFFSKTGLFLDLPNSQLGLCRDFNTLQENGYFTASFTKTPLSLNHPLAEIELMTEEGPLRCILDTGATLSLFNTNKPGEKGLFEDQPKKTKFKKLNLTIGGQDFGSQRFIAMPINLSLRIDAILGMDFLKQHQVFLDFTNREAYFIK